MLRTRSGESRPVTVESGGSLWAGTFLVNGEGTARVVATGADTRLAGIAHLADTAARPPGPLAVELARAVRTMAVLTVGVGVAFFLLTGFTGTPARDGLLFAVGVTVALVPEGFLPTLTLSLAMGAQRMAERHALLRHLQAVETLGSTTFVCTDKTGTLTRNEMSAAGLQCSQGRAVEHDGSWLAVGDPMEAERLAALDRDGALAIAGIHLSDIPSLRYQEHLFEERQLRSVTANTRADGEEFPALAAAIPLRVETTTFELPDAAHALADLAHDRVTGAAVIRIGGAEVRTSGPPPLT